MITKISCLTLLIFLSGCTIEMQTEVKLGKEAEDLIKKVSKKLDGPVEHRIIKEWTVSEQDELLLRLTELNPDAEPREFIEAYEYITGEPYRAVIQRHMGNVLGPLHPYRVGDLNKDHKTNEKDVSVCNLSGGRLW